MSKYEARIRRQENSFYAMIVRVDRDGEETVIHGYKPRFFKTVSAATKSTTAHIEGMNKSVTAANKVLAAEPPKNEALNALRMLEAAGLLKAIDRNDIKQLRAVAYASAALAAADAQVQS